VTQGQGPLNDPRLVARRGDLSGLNAALFVLLVIAAFIAAAYLLATYLHIGASGSASPSGGASPSVSASRTPGASASPQPSPTSTPGQSTVPIVAIGQAVDVVVGGKVIGTVTVVSATFPDTVRGKRAGIGQRWMVARIRYLAADTMSFGPADWVVLDGAGVRHVWARTDERQPLGTGTADPGAKKSGNVTFRVPLTGELSVVMVRPDGSDRLVVPIQ
jgi:hypothetical protein